MAFAHAVVHVNLHKQGFIFENTSAALAPVSSLPARSGTMLNASSAPISLVSSWAPLVTPSVDALAALARGAIKTAASFLSALVSPVPALSRSSLSTSLAPTSLAQPRAPLVTHWGAALAERTRLLFETSSALTLVLAVPVSSGKFLFTNSAPISLVSSWAPLATPLVNVPATLTGGSFETTSALFQLWFHPCMRFRESCSNLTNSRLDIVQIGKQG